MINHCLTLFLNHAANDSVEVLEPDELEEYIEPTFVPLPIPDYMKPMRSLLFGSQHLRREANYRARQLFTILHSGELEPYVLALDSRITYLPFTSNPTLPAKDLLAVAHLPCAFVELAKTPNFPLFDASKNRVFTDFEHLSRSPLFTDRLGGFVLAMIYKLEEMRKECNREVEGHQVLDVDRSFLSRIRPWTARTTGRTD